MTHAFGAAAFDNSLTSVHEMAPVCELGDFRNGLTLMGHEFTSELSQLGIDPLALDLAFGHGAGVLFILLMFGEGGHIDFLYPFAWYADHAIVVTQHQVA